ncbi:2'-5' RNA ligase family protein [Frankia sp. R82]|uniref:2'-5' RNA ligase family protein n=1 Tax=Frankia sp. R82 TaxID=2950553 RepID=UPI002043685C|nr:2'-5' RNA ligase family protein [Frankia sp. R82]MCM3886829.1 2'-5' RNA ligase family protein [Frankia sp. R82]
MGSDSTAGPGPGLSRAAVLGAEASAAERFWQLDRLHNHWARPGLRRSWQWYLTFENSPELRALVARCQAAIADDVYDPVALDSLHLTLDRIAANDAITSTQIAAVAAAGRRVCARLRPFDITTGSLAGTAGALGLAVGPVGPLRQLRAALHEATHSVLPTAPPLSARFEPHVSIAYCNTDDVPAAQAHTAVRTLQALPAATGTVTAAVLVDLERRERTYVWRPVASIPLSS